MGMLWDKILNLEAFTFNVHSILRNKPPLSYNRCQLDVILRLPATTAVRPASAFEHRTHMGDGKNVAVIKVPGLLHR